MTGWEEAKKGKLRVVLFLAGRGIGLDSLLQRSCGAPKSYEIVGALTTTPDSQAIPILEEWGIPWRCHDIHDFYRRQGARVSDLNLRPEFDRKSLELITEFHPSSLALYGYIYILSPVVLEAFPSRILNIHDSDLTLMNGDGKPRYRGLHATRDAILAGETSTCSTVHTATEELDAGPILVRSVPYPVHIELVKQARGWGALDILKAYAYAHREWMMRECWGPLMDTALELMGRGRVSISEGRVLMDGRVRHPEVGASYRPFTRQVGGDAS
ncbi:MAG TPA: formyltransferase family protein [Nitrospiria bacterium]|nr:formyltransferase family protein [Nitrospiria bacterium]